MKHYLAIILAFLINQLQAQTAESIENYGHNTIARSLIHQIAEKNGFDENYLISLLLAIHRDDSVLAKISRPAEKTKPWFEYAKIFSDTARLKDGIAFYQANQHWLQKAYSTYGVDPSIIVAIIGIETRYGKVTGNTPVFSALATLCFDYPRRSPFFCAELENFLKLAKRENWNPLHIQGSYAGAMGMGQFMPSSYLNDAIDFDGDEHINLWQSPADAIGSVAQYLSKRGWQKNGAIYHLLPEKPEIANFDGKHQPHFFLQELTTDEKLKNDHKFIKWIESQPNEKVGSLILQGENQILAFITYNNFYVITRYNTSPMYAMAVSNLAQGIKDNLNNQESLP